MSRILFPRWGPLFPTFQKEISIAQTRPRLDLRGEGKRRLLRLTTESIEIATADAELRGEVLPTQVLPLEPTRKRALVFRWAPYTPLGRRHHAVDSAKRLSRVRARGQRDRWTSAGPPDYRSSLSTMMARCRSPLLPAWTGMPILLALTASAAASGSDPALGGHSARARWIGSS